MAMGEGDCGSMNSLEIAERMFRLFVHRSKRDGYAVSKILQAVIRLLHEHTIAKIDSKHKRLGLVTPPFRVVGHGCRHAASVLDSHASDILHRFNAVNGNVAAIDMGDTALRDGKSISRRRIVAARNQQGKTNRQQRERRMGHEGYFV